MPSDGKVKVIFILGWVRTGSTLLDNLLGELDGIFSCGELRYLWDRGMIKGWMCGCRTALRDCQFWSTVLADAFGSPPRGGIDPAKVAQDHLTLVRSTRLLRVLNQQPSVPLRWPQLEDYIDVLDRLYRSIARVAGARVVVDSSKFAQDAALVRLVPGVDAYYVHLVRDPRAVAYSNMRNRHSQPDPNEPVEMAQWSPSRSTARWMRFNLAAEAVRRRHQPDRSMLLRYEDFISRPREALGRITRMAGEKPYWSLFIGDRTAKLSGNHTVWGNPSRFRTGRVELRLDDEWVRNLKGKDFLVPTVLSLPLLIRYGYPIRVPTDR